MSINKNYSKIGLIVQRATTNTDFSLSNSLAAVAEL